MLHGFECLSGDRLETALRLLFAPELDNRLESAEQYRKEIKNKLPILRHLNNGVEAVQVLAAGNQQLAELYEHLSQDNNDQSTIQSLQYHMDSNRQLMSRMRQEFSAFKYPYDHGKGEISLSEFVVAELPKAEDLGAIFDTTARVIESTIRLRARLTGNLCLIAEKVEAAFGFEALEEPSDGLAANADTHASGVS